MVQARAFEHPFMYWVGMDTDPRTASEALAEFNRFYSTTHVGEVLAAPPASSPQVGTSYSTPTRAAACIVVRAGWLCTR
jgi:hypothetical protein